VKLRPLRQRRRGRIEIIPMIDVMFFLLATFMLASLALQNLHSLGINLPRGDAPKMPVVTPVTLTVTPQGDLRLNDRAVTLDALPAVLRSFGSNPEGNLVVAADSAAPSGIVVQAMLKAREAGTVHFLFAVAPTQGR
jgi:biopolymer transport protein ExbD